MIHLFRGYGIPPGGYPPNYQGDERPHFMKTVFIITAVVIFVIGAAALVIVNEPKCIQSHTEQRWREAYTTHPYMASSNLALRMQTMRHPARWETVTICDKYEEKTK